MKQQIAALQPKIDAAEKRRDELRAKADPDWRLDHDEVKQLREEKALLLKKEEQLRDELKRQGAALVEPSTTTEATVRLLLQQQAERDAKQQAERDAKLFQRLEERDVKLEQQLAALHIGGLGSPSNSERGHSLLKHCSSVEEGITPLMLQRALNGGATQRAAAATGSSDPPLHERPILSAAELQRLLGKLDASYLEVELVALLTPTLLDVIRQLPDPDQLLVNSESLRWLRTESGVDDHFQKPDLFVCHRSAFVAGSSPAGTTDAATRAAQFRVDSATGLEAFLLGRCAWQLREAVECIIEAKRRKMTLNEALGECFAKAQNLLRDSPRPTRKVVLFDAQCVQLLVFTSSGLLSLQKFEWTAPGSFVVLLDFLHTPPTAEPDWLCVLRGACSHFRVTLAPTNAFLGQGATGRVFQVLKSSTCLAGEDAEEEVKSAGAASAPRGYALKVVEGGKQGEHITSLCREVEQLTRLLSTPEDRPVRRHLPRSCSELYTAYDPEGREQLGAAAMFEPVGVSLGEAKRSESLWMEVCRALAALHAAGIWHGDPRLPNLVRVSASKPRAGATATRLASASSSTADAELVWIDFRTSSHSATPFDICFDCRVLLHSFFAHVSKEDPRLDRLSKQYSVMLDTLRGSAASFMSELSAWCQQAWRELQRA